MKTNLNNQQKENNNFLYFASVKDFDYNQVLKLLPPARLEKIKNLKNESDKKLSAGAWILLKKALALHGINADNFNLNCTKTGKPYLENCPFCFSVSHSAEYVLAGISKSDIGVDIQLMKTFNKKLLGYICNENDLNFYNLSQNKTNAFYTIWTFKEAIIKKSGKGLANPLNSIEIQYPSKCGNDFLSEFDIVENYKIATATSDFEITSIAEIKL